MLRAYRGVLTAVMLAGVTLHAGCAAAADQTPPVDTGAVRAQIDSMWTGLSQAMVNADTAALARYYTEDVSFAETGVPTMRGRAALVSGAAEAFGGMRYIESRFEPELTEFWRDRVFQLGTYRDVVQPTGQATLEARGRLSAVIERDSAGAWRVGRLFVIRDSVRPLTGQPR